MAGTEPFLLTGQEGQVATGVQRTQQPKQARKQLLHRRVTGR